jgi:predicted ribonuclease YlaK
MSGINPFPQYPVSQLDENLSGIDRRTWVTEPIRQERAVIANWIEHPETPLIVAVLGEYGSGKTHLLLDAMATLRRELDDRQPRLSFLPVVALAESPLGWYRAEIGPKLADLPLEKSPAGPS